ncbi:MAG: hypothetical protein JOZ85_05960 [Betaproteobacteria bacterium]|nr:hypothetical protein [Betaproteobacteria bacterium]
MHHSVSRGTFSTASAPPRRINEIVRGLRGITALPLARYFRTTPQFRLTLQQRYDIEAAEDELGARIRRIKVGRGPPQR